MKTKLIFILLFILYACKSPIVPEPEPDPIPIAEITVTLAFVWDHDNPETVSGYYFYYGFVSGEYENKIDVGNKREYTIEIEKGKIHYFSVTAYNEIGESGFSNEVEWYEEK